MCVDSVRLFLKWRFGCGYRYLEGDSIMFSAMFVGAMPV